MYHTNCPASQNPPHGLPPSEVPQFVTFGFDDNGHSGYATDTLEGMAWASQLFSSRKNHDGSPCTCSFFHASHYITEEGACESPSLVRRAWRSAHEEGHDTGNHSHHHPWGQQFTTDAWLEEIDLCNHYLSAPYPNEGVGIALSEIRGFRTPYLGYNDAVFKAIYQRGFLYDCSIEEGSQKNQDGTNYFWPYTLDHGSPGNHYDHKRDSQELPPLVGHYPGLWEVPCHMVIAPPDELCEAYGILPGFRQRLDERKHAVDEDNDFDPLEGKITGLDYNCLVLFGMDASEWLGTLKYTLDLRLQGNRAPFTFGGHTDVYATGYDICPRITIAERREVVEQFIEYALSKSEVRIDNYVKIVHWMTSPTPLSSL